MYRRDLLKTAAALTALSQAPLFAAQQPTGRIHRLNQGPFPVEEDQGWQTILATTPSERPVRNPGLGLVAYTWNENGASEAVRAGKQSLEDHVEALASLPFADVLYIRCDWRDVQTQRGRLDMHPVWELTLAAARRHNLRVAFRIQLSSPNFQPEQISLPEYLRKEIPLVPIGEIPKHPGKQYLEPAYDSPAFQRAFRELNDLLAARFDGDPLIEWVDLMQYGFWGEGHTSNYKSPFHDAATAQATMLAITEHQLSTWKRTPLAVNMQPDISRVGNNAVQRRAIAAGAWLRSDSILVEEAIQIDQIANRPAHAAAILEDGYYRRYDSAELTRDDAGVNILENAMLHTLDLGANYWSLWSEPAHLREYYAKYSRGIDRLRTSLGYRLRPAWVWQRKYRGAPEILVAIANRGVAGVPGTLWLELSTTDGKLQLRGSLDAGLPVGGGLRQASFRLPAYVAAVRLKATLETRPNVFHPVAWAMEQAVEADGSILIALKPEDDPKWRKGV